MPGYQEKPELGSGEQKLWTMVIEQGIRDATRKRRQSYWNGDTLSQARQFFQKRDCDVILRLLGVDPEWFIGKLKSRHPGVFQIEEGE